MWDRLASSYAESAQSAYFDLILVEIWHHPCMGADDLLHRIKPGVEAGKANQVIIDYINAGVYAWISAWKSVQDYRQKKGLRALPWHSIKMFGYAQTVCAALRKL